MLRKVEQYPGLVRHSQSKAVLNTDVTSLEAYKARREKDRKLAEMITQWDNVSSDISDLKLMLSTVLNKLEKIENK